jgi:hypothetical protein
MKLHHVIKHLQYTFMSRAQHAAAAAAAPLAAAAPAGLARLST